MRTAGRHRRTGLAPAQIVCETNSANMTRRAYSSFRGVPRRTKSEVALAIGLGWGWVTRTQANVGFERVFSPHLEKACLGLFDGSLCPPGQGRCIPCNGDGQKFGPESLTAIAPVVTCGDKCATRAKILRFIFLLQSQGSGEIGPGDAIRGFAVDPKRDKSRRKWRGREERVFRDERSCHGSWKCGYGGGGCW